MQLHHEPVLDAHAGHLHQHVTGEGVEIRRGCFTRARAVEDRRRVGVREPRRERRQRRMVGGRRAHRLEERAPLLERCDVAPIARDLLAGERAEARHFRRPVGMQDVDREVGPERRPHLTLPARRPNRLMMDERVGRGVGGAEHLDVEALEERARSKRGRPELRFDAVVDRRGVGRGQALVDAEHVRELVLQPAAARRAAKQVEVIGEELPDRPRIGFDRCAIERGHPQPLERTPCE